MEKVLILLAKILADKKTRDKVLIFIGSIVVGFLLLLAAPIIAIYTLGNVEIEPPVFKALCEPGTTKPTENLKSIVSTPTKITQRIHKQKTIPYEQARNYGYLRI